jgi:hypothetical protein
MKFISFSKTAQRIAFAITAAAATTPALAETEL